MKSDGDTEPIYVISLCIKGLHSLKSFLLIFPRGFYSTVWLFMAGTLVFDSYNIRLVKCQISISCDVMVHMVHPTFPFVSDSYNRYEEKKVNFPERALRFSARVLNGWCCRGLPLQAKYLPSNCLRLQGFDCIVCSDAVKNGSSRTSPSPIVSSLLSILFFLLLFR